MSYICYLSTFRLSSNAFWWERTASVDTRVWLRLLIAGLRHTDRALEAEASASQQMCRVSAQARHIFWHMCRVLFNVPCIQQNVPGLQCISRPCFVDPALTVESSTTTLMRFAREGVFGDAWQRHYISGDSRAQPQVTTSSWLHVWQAASPRQHPLPAPFGVLFSPLSLWTAEFPCLLISTLCSHWSAEVSRREMQQMFH